jgi:hypothetical protein
MLWEDIFACPNPSDGNVLVGSRLHMIFGFTFKNNRGVLCRVVGFKYKGFGATNIFYQSFLSTNIMCHILMSPTPCK